MIGEWKITAADVADDQIVSMDDHELQLVLNKTIRIAQDNIYFDGSSLPNYPRPKSEDDGWVEMLGTAKQLSQEGPPRSSHEKGPIHYISPILNRCTDKNSQPLSIQQLETARQLDFSVSEELVQLPHSFYIVDDETLVGDNAGVLFCLKKIN